LVSIAALRAIMLVEIDDRRSEVFLARRNIDGIAGLDAPVWLPTGESGAPVTSCDSIW